MTPTVPLPAHPPVLAAVLTLGAAGVLAGAAARVLLARLRRGARIRAPLCELVTGAGWAACAVGWASGVVPPDWLPVLLFLCWLGVAAGAVDLTRRLLPDALVLPAFPLVLLLLVPIGADAVLRGLVGALLAAGVHAVWHLGAPRALGAGDVKLAAPLGAVLAAAAWPAPALAAGLAALLTGGAAIVAVVLARARGRPRPAALAHGPSMLAATVTVLVATIAAAGTGPG
ncbi:prepilin peptidase [Pseudonocardia sp. CA-107938]|uniref:prepilin peptidase n=1 Tax=Pseudonocardia sp. CA-107938 TaxID=3240021 RepID=UPI003D8F6741